MYKSMPIGVFVFLFLSYFVVSVHAADANPKDDGYRGIWFTLGTKRTINEYGDKYSGGLGTYTANHVPMAVYAKEVEKTFFVYGGAKKGKQILQAMISYYDHKNNRVPRPTVVHDWQTAEPALSERNVNDPHDNPSLCIDDKGHIWVFVSGRGSYRLGLVYRSAEPYGIERFELIRAWEETYPQPWWVKGKGLLLLFTKYTSGRELYWAFSRNSMTSSFSRNGTSRWYNDNRFAGFGGHYQSSAQVGGSVVTAFNFHPDGKSDERTNLYYLRTDDCGRTWRNFRGEAVKTPLDRSDNPALVRDYLSEKRFVYIHDLNLDRQGRPLILYTTSAYHEAGPQGDPRWWTVAYWNGTEWNYTEVTRANHNYSTGSIHVEDDLWRIIGPTETGPQPHGCGGEVAVWTSRDEGKTWHKDRDATHGSEFNHTYVRRPLHAHPDFYAFWADGDTRKPCKSHLYFCDKTGENVRRLPYDMKEDFANPEPVR
ncbi:MAG: BNR-4 repeat-containing protein [Pirellulales bacterium]|nr:BNR-4 repeat-containing protein [Pirellulales bacterium]